MFEEPSMYVSSPRENKAKLNARRIQAKIITLLMQNPEGLGFNQLFKKLEESSTLKNYTILSTNLKQLTASGLIKKTKAAGPGFGKSIYTLSQQAEVTQKSDVTPKVMFDFSSAVPLPYVITAAISSGELKRVHIQAGKRADFEKAVNMTNTISEHCRAVMQNMSVEERAFFAKLLESFSKLLQLQSSIIRGEENEAEAMWTVYFSVVMRDLEEFFEEYARYIAQQESLGKISKNVTELRQKFGQVTSAMLMPKRIDLNKVQIFEK
jgi:DNA-binding HxlR family transcriptional regulator